MDTLASQDTSILSQLIFWPTELMNERITEELVRSKLRDLGYYDEESGIYVEEQKSENPLVTKCLRNASKTGGSGMGKPEFLISSEHSHGFLVVIECKADAQKHESPNRGQIKDFAVDGVLHYAAHLAAEFNVIAVAVSGQDVNNLKISTFVHPKKAHKAKNLSRKGEEKIERFLPFERLVSAAQYDKDVERVQYEELMAYSRDLHNYIRDYAKLSEAQKPLLVSGILIALRAGHFRSGYTDANAEDLPQFLFDAIKQQINRAKMPQTKKEHVIQPYSFITAHTSLSQVIKGRSKSTLQEIISDIDRLVYPFVSIHNDFDVIGQFYAEFLRYAGGDASLGIVLTPRHVAELFVEIANLNTSSVVLDTCAGTGSFLISSMMDMCKKANTNEDEERIKKIGLVGIENQPKMFALAASNMILRGDGKANLYQGSCFDKKIVSKVKKHRPSVGMINPPYAQKGEGLHELNFIDQMLECLIDGGTGIAIVPMSCAIQAHPMKDILLKKHTLIAVMSMPNDLFHPVGCVPCIMVFKAKIPHDSNPHHKTWFAYWKDDGFKKIKHKGRMDVEQTWEDTKRKWLSGFFNKDSVPGLSVSARVEANEEWCAEAYMETDYSRINQSLFESTVKNYALFMLGNEA